MKSDAFRKWIGLLPCLICGDNTTTEAAHVSCRDNSIAKNERAFGRKASDVFCVPLCGKHHREQHGGNERAFWERCGVDPVKTALALYTAFVLKDPTWAGEICEANKRI